ncbi:MAG: SLC13/DASS family transporter, partial [Methylococcales bacterium]|nr:SLC13/DASS family transporter [Methylococcales bacterium]
KITANQYTNSIIFLFMGGFMIALAMQRWNLHKRIALLVLAGCGGYPIRLVVGFSLASAILSMWISNTATTLMMLPIALAILNRCEALYTALELRRFSVGLLLSIAYSASVGGMMTLVGTAPNLVFAKFYEQATEQSIGFTEWMFLAMPIGIIMLSSILLIIFVVYLRNLPHSVQLQQLVQQEKSQLKPISFEEKSVLLVFMMTALLWVTRKNLTIGDISFQGWSDFLTFGVFIDDGTVAITMATILFFIPAKTASNEKTTLLDGNVFKQLPWNVVVLFGGGFALAYGFAESGLSAYLASQLESLKGTPMPILVSVVTLGMSLLTELTSNTATTQLVLPVLISTAKVIETSPIWLMLPATLAASCAFMFPVATPPNTIIFGSGKVAMWDMLKVGILLNIIAVITISVGCFFIIPNLI